MRLGTYHLRKALLHQVASRSGPLARLLRYPNPFDAPWRRPVLHIVNDGGIGDALLCTPALREVKRRNPTCRVHFYSKFSPLLNGLSYIDAALSVDDQPDSAIHMDYIDVVPPLGHLPRARLASLLGDKIGLRLTDDRPDCVIRSDLVASYTHRWQGLPRPYIVITRRGRTWTPNKDWPDDAWGELVDRLSRRATLIEIGEAGEPDAISSGRNHIDLRGRTSLEELAAVIAAGDIHVGPLSGPAHIAAAAATPAVLIYGGFEHPSNTVQPNQTALYTQTPCAPCWLRTPCPYDRKCLRAISPKTVEEAVWRLWNNPPES